MLPSEFCRCCAGADEVSSGEDEMALPAFCEFAVPFACGTQRPMLDPE